ncbi:Putative protein [Zobellia galactanivorans]|uniref:Uncharacterized protein n=1 Tax=Zobellia galactanivorans (strain DSM 12802 / CCUG 47099 / CIP 106680 / NCIMB 13871 / Dsij) TaxID=63186 RepID=G0L177_ZOBGA|nr:Putative protein [Zobellia galactanivorans]
MFFLITCTAFYISTAPLFAAKKKFDGIKKALFYQGLLLKLINSKQRLQA